MAVHIRLKRTGSRNRAIWRVVVSDVKMPRDGRFIEEIGYYNPLPVEEIFEVKKDRLDYWVSQGAKMSNSLETLLKRSKKKAKASATKASAGKSTPA